MQMPFGKHRDKYLDDIPDDYLCWVLDNCTNISPTLRRAIEETLGLRTELGDEDIQALVSKWYRTLCLRCHPDRGGTTEAMQIVNASHELLQSMIKGKVNV